MQLTVNLPDEIGRRVRRLSHRNRFVAEALRRALDDQRPEGETPRPVPKFGSAKGLIEMRFAGDGQFSEGSRGMLRRFGEAVLLGL